MIRKAGESLLSNDTKSGKMDAESSKKTGGCCSGSSSCSTTEHTLTHSHAALPQGVEMKKGPKTRIVVKFDVGFNNIIYIRGQGANLNWERGFPLKNIKSDEWIWETELPFTAGEFKVLINDRQYEIGENHKLSYGATVQYTPRF